jgi:hypothetical protein
MVPQKPLGDSGSPLILRLAGSSPASTQRRGHLVEKFRQARGDPVEGNGGEGVRINHSEVFPVKGVTSNYHREDASYPPRLLPACFVKRCLAPHGSWGQRAVHRQMP